MRARAGAWLGVLLSSVMVAVSCGGDDPPGAPNVPSGSGGEAEGGSHDAGGASGPHASGTGGDPASAGASSIGGSGNAQGGGAGEPAGGANNRAGETSGAGADANSGSGSGGMPNGAAGQPGTPDAGAGGGGAEPPDLIVETGGPWPDSFTGSCSSASALIACPQADQPLFGQDGSYRLSVPTYSSTVSTATDSVTGLTWQLKPAASSKSQADAESYCDGLSLAGQDDWRLPTRLEYVTLLDVGLPNGFAVPPPIPTDTTGTHWTQSPTATSSDAFFVVDDHFGLLNVATSATPYLARCVRGPALTGSLTIGTDTVIDSMTSLEWQRTNIANGGLTWQQALAHCESLDHADKTDWRLPSIKELVTLVDEGIAEAPVVSAAVFGETNASQFWSSTPGVTFSQEKVAFTLETSFGATPTVKMADVSAARCVRSAD